MQGKAKILIIFVLVVIVIVAGVYFFVLPPRVIKIVVDSSIIIKFDKPVKRQMLEHFIVPEVYGEWKFEKPIIKNHLFRTLVFEPAIEFEPDTDYQVRLENIISPVGMGLSNKFSFNFKTKSVSTETEEISQKEIASIEISVPSQPKLPITILDIPLDWQDNALSCEAACLKMALNFKGVQVSENDIMEQIGYDLSSRKNNLWGDPHQIYIGNIDGKICKTGYGVYWDPVAKAGNNWRDSQAFSKLSLQSLIKEIQLGNPVIVWGVLPVETLTDCSWFTAEGRYIKAYKETHVRLVIGFIGAQSNPLKIILNDPLAGQVYWTTSEFLTNWAVFGYKGVVVR